MRLDVVAQVVEQQNTFLVVTDLLLNVTGFHAAACFAGGTGGRIPEHPGTKAW